MACGASAQDEGQAGEAKASAEAAREAEAYTQLLAGRDAFDAGRFEDARSAFAFVVAVPGSEYAAYAHARLAAIARYDGRAWEGLRHARLALEGCSEKDLYARPLAETEFVRCHLELGLADRVAGASRALLLSHPPGSDMHAEALLVELDTCLALGDLRRVQRLSQRALQHPSIDSMDHILVEKIRLRSLLAAREQAVTPAALASVAREMEAATDTIHDDRSIRTARHMTAEAWLDAGELDQAERIVTALLDEAGDFAAADGRLLILRCRLARARGNRFDALGDLHSQLESVNEAWLGRMTAIPLRASGYGLLNDRATSEVLATLTWLDALVLDADSAAASILERTEALAALGTLSRRLGCQRGDLESLLALRPERGGILMITLGPRNGSIVAVDKATTVHALELDAHFWREADRLARAIAEGPKAVGDTAAARALAERLATLLLPPAVRARIASWQSMLLIGGEHATELVQWMPWQNSWLCLEKAITHAPSVAVAAALEQRAKKDERRRRSAKITVFADPSLGASVQRRWGVAPLKIDKDRIANMSAVFEPEFVTTFVGNAATAAALQSRALAESSVLCVLGHGAQDFERERSACLLVHGADPTACALDSVAIERLHMPPLVLLGVCEAATGPVRQGDEGAQHLGGAFLYAGADCVVLSPGKLALGATCDLLTVCLREWHNGASAAEALRRARNEVAAASQRAHPYFFAGMRLLGRDFPALNRR